MAEQSENGQLKEDIHLEQTVEDRARLIEKSLIEYQKLCNDPEKISTIGLNKIRGNLKYMSQHLLDDEGHRFDGTFIGYMKLISVIAKTPPPDFCQQFIHLTKILCFLCRTIGERITLFDRILKVWLEILKSVPSQQKHTACLNSDSEFKMCAQSIASANSASVQHKLLDIIHTYFDGESKDTSQPMRVLFKKGPFHTNDMCDYDDIDYDSFDQKQLLIYRLNQRLQQPTVFTEMAQAVKIGNETITFENDDGFIHFNEQAKTVEFWIRFDHQDLKVTIRATNVNSIHIIDNDSPYAMEMQFNLNSSVRIETTDGKKADVEELKGEQITVEYVLGILTSKVQPLLSKMFHKEAIIINSSDEENGLDEDSDIEIIEPSDEHIFSQIPKKIPDKVKPSTRCVSSKSEKVKKPSDFLREIQSSEVTKKRQLEERLPKVEEVGNWSSDEMDESPNKKPKNDRPIPTCSFYGKEEKSDVRSSSSKSKPAAIRDDSSAVTIKKERVPMPPKVTKKRQLEGRQPIVEACGDSSSDEIDESPNKKSKNGPIPTRLFNGKVEKVDVDASPSRSKPVAIQSSEVPEKRTTKRRAAQKAAGTIKDMADDNVFDFPCDEFVMPKTKAKGTTRKAVPPRKTTLKASVLRSPFKRSAPKPRKLRNLDEADSIDVDAIEEENKKKPKVQAEPSLTGISFRSSFNVDTKKQNERVIKNLDRINENVARRPNASFSYRAMSSTRKNTQQVADSTIASNESKGVLDHFDGSFDENIDANANKIKSCTCGGLSSGMIHELKTIKNATERLLTVVDTNARNCRCGMSTGPESSMQRTQATKNQPSCSSTEGDVSEQSNKLNH